jgi:hypothetical protein
MRVVGARTGVHLVQFNGKQEGAPPTVDTRPALPPQRSAIGVLSRQLVCFSHWALGPGKAAPVASPSPDTGQQVVRRALVCHT